VNQNNNEQIMFCFDIHELPDLHGYIIVQLWQLMLTQEQRY
jgi:hypothetical protein